MTLTEYRTPELLATASAELIYDSLTKKPDSLCCFSSGFTQNETYDVLTKMLLQKNFPVGKLRVIGLDEWQGLGGSDKGSCRAYMNERFFEPLGIKPLHFFNGKNDSEAQCREADDLLDREGPIDICVLGIGMNGHLGFNEPGTPESTRSHAKNLDALTVQVGGKYFDGNAAPSAGITLGLRDLLASKLILAQIVGAHKAPVFEKLISSPPSVSFPASLLKNTDALVYVCLHTIE